MDTSSSEEELLESPNESLAGSDVEVEPGTNDVGGEDYSRPVKIRVYRPEGCRHSSIVKPNNIVACPKCPYPRSGHRVFATDDYLYIVGGFNGYVRAQNGSMTLCDMWSMNLLTNEWSRVRLPARNFPDTMASFSLTHVPERRKFYVYGGTGVPFGGNVTADLYECTMTSDDSCDIRQLPVVGDKAPHIYGQSTVYRISAMGEVEIYLLGGTSGTTYHMHVYKLTIHSDNATCKRLSQHLNEPQERYRHESVLYGSKIFSIGGTDNTTACSMETLDVFDLNSNLFHQMLVSPDPEQGYPAIRKGHALVQRGSIIYMLGGMVPHENPNGEMLLNCVWRLDLEIMEWRRHPHNLPFSVFFHSAAINPSGEILQFGGCVSAALQPSRTQAVVGFFVRPPHLAFLTGKRIFRHNPALMNQQPGIRMSSLLNVARLMVLDKDEYLKQYDGAIEQ